MKGAGQALTLLLRHARRRAWLQSGLAALSLAAGVAALLDFAGAGSTRTLATALVVLAACLLAARCGERFRRLDLAHLAAHLDRRHPELEESTALLLCDAGKLGAVQRLQRSRTESALAALDISPTRSLPPIRWRWPAAGLGLAALLVLFGQPLGEAWREGATQAAARGSDSSGGQTLTGIEVTVTPPAYTGLPEHQQSSLDIELPEGSQVTWRLGLSGASSWALDITGEPPLPLVNDGAGHWVAERTVQRTSLVQLVADGEAWGDIHTLAVVRDTPPRLRVLEPGQTTLEIPLAGPAEFNSKVRIEDDHGIDRVEIRASLGSGGGEGVKFRDEVLTFDSSTLEDNASIYERFWDLLRMEMEPGDEVYFFVTATDFRQPEPNTGRSETITVRWLDEAEPVTVAEGFGIDVMPDYFKSQRQIIIETEQLIADREQLDATTFEDTSRALAQAQADLKQRYGQYLGDEFEESEGGEFTEMAPGDGGEDGDADHDGEDHEEGHDDEGPDGPAMHSEFAGVGHDHGDTPAAIDTQGDAAALIARFAHNHGAAEIGPITARNPVGMMKRSINNMWQAELHLHLSEPEEALPYEYEALKYLNLARQAERIYTRRLGFEPPPVSEERRLTGDLDDIQSWQRQGDGVPAAGDDLLFRSLYQALARWGATPTQDDLELAERARDRLTELAQERPALIRQAASLQALVSRGIEGCDDCLPGLMAMAWAQAGSPTAPPTRGESSPGMGDDLTRDFLERLAEDAK